MLTEAKFEGAHARSKGMGVPFATSEGVPPFVCGTHMLWLADTNFCTRIDQVMLARGVVINKKNITNVHQSSSHHHWSREVFSTMKLGGLQ